MSFFRKLFGRKDKDDTKGQPGNKDNDDDKTQLGDADDASLGDETESAYHTYQPGDVISNGFTMEELIGEGGMGYVYKASNGRITCAVKQPKEYMLTRDEFKTRILREGMSWVNLGLHPHIAYCYFCREVDDSPLIFIEYYEGGTLKNRISQGDCLTDVRMSLDLSIQLCHGMEWAHKHGLKHRDIKPANILISRDNIVKVTDFGLAGAIESMKDSVNIPGEGTTQLGKVMGSRPYMSPMQYTNPSATSETDDVYSFGVCLWEMLAGNRPRVDAFDKSPYPDVVQLTSLEQTPQRMIDILHRVCALDPEERYRDFLQLQTDLQTLYREMYDEPSPYEEIEIPEQDAAVLNNRGYSYYMLGEKKEAIKCFREGFEKDRLHFPVVYNSLFTDRSFEIDDFKTATQYKDFHIKQYPDHMMLYFYRINHESGLRTLADVSESWPQEMTGKPIWISNEQHILPKSLVFSCDGSHIASTSNSGSRSYGDSTGHIGYFYVKTGYEGSLEYGHFKWPATLVFSYDGRMLASGSGDDDIYTLVLWDIDTQKRIWRKKHAKRVVDVLFSPDGEFLASLAQDGSLIVWNTGTGKPALKIGGKKIFTTCIAFSPNSKYIATGSNHSIHLYQVETGRMAAEFDKVPGWISNIAFCSKGRHLCSVAGSSFLLWNVSTGRMTQQANQSFKLLHPVVFSKDCRFIFLPSRKNEILMWDVYSGELVRRFTGHKPVMYGNRDTTITTIDVSQDGNFLLSGSSEGEIALWHINTGFMIRYIRTHGVVSSLSFSPDGEFFVSGGTNRRVCLWWGMKAVWLPDLLLSPIVEYKEIQNRYQVFQSLYIEAVNHHDPDKAMQLLLDASRLAGYERDERIRQVIHLTFLRTGNFKRRWSNLISTRIIEIQKSPVDAVCFSPDGRLLASGGGQWHSDSDHTIRFWDVATGREVRKLEGHTSSVSSVSFSPDGRLLASGSWDYTVRLWDVATGTEVRQLEGHTESVSSVSFSPDGRLLASGSWDYTVRLWDVATGTEVHKLEGHTNNVNSVSFSPNGKLIASGSVDKTIRLWEVSTGKDFSIITGTFANWVDVIAFSPDGNLIAYADNWRHKEFHIYLLDVVTGKKLRKLEGHTRSVTSVSFSPDGRFLASGSKDETFRLWELEYDYFRIDSHANETVEPQNE